MSPEQLLTKILSLAGMAPNGPHPYDPQIKNPGLYARVQRGGMLALGESYMENWWDCQELDVMFDRLMRADVKKLLGISWPMVSGYLWSRLTNLQSIPRAFQVGEQHYDLGNDLFEAMLGSTMAYSCGYWKDAANLDEAQAAKFDLICRKLDFQPGMKVLEIGCGWGTFAKFATQKYGVKITGLTVSVEQAELARKLCAGLSVEILVQDYRTYTGQFDRIVSVGMFEHVGSKNYRAFMKTARECLKPDGLMLLHTMGSLRPAALTDPWVHKYIFPNGQLPSLAQINRAVQGMFVIEDLHNFGAYYDRTLMAWQQNFERAWPELRGKYDVRFRRMWNYYLFFFAAMFRSRQVQLWQFVLSPKGVPGGYHSIR